MSACELPWRRLLGTPVLDAAGSIELGRIRDAACDPERHLVRVLILIQRQGDEEAARLVVCAAGHLSGWSGGVLRSSLAAPASAQDWRLLGSALGAVQRSPGLWWPRRCLGLPLQDAAGLRGRIQDLRFAAWPLRCAAVQAGEPGRSQRVALDQPVQTDGELVCLGGPWRRPGIG